MSVLSIDFETRSRVDLRKSGTHVYAADPTTDIWCMAFAFDDEDVELWTPRWDGGSRRARIEAHVQAGGEMRAWNAQFERLIWRDILGPRYRFPVPHMGQWYDTAADAAALGLPRGLGKAADVLGLPTQKDDAGHRLMLQMSKPRSVKGGRVAWWDTPDRLHRLYEYCRQDVRVERAIGERTRKLPASERRIYLLDQIINDRGVLVDVDLVLAAQQIVREGTRRANAELADITNGEVTSVTKVADLTQYLGVENVRKDTIRDYLDGDPCEIKRRVAELRAETAKSSTAKLNAMLACAGADDRARGQHLYHGAATGRWAGRLIQVQNFPRPEVQDVEQFIPHVLENKYDLIEAEQPALVVVSSMLRSMLRAAPGHRLIAGDFAQIEARVLAWIAGQDDLVEAFRTGEKIYERMGAAYSGKPLEEITKDSEERQVGKNSVLGAGFQMGADRFAEQVWAQSGIALEPDTAQHIITTYRETYPKIPEFWRDINNAARNAVLEPGSVCKCGRIQFVVRGPFLWCVLPSGRALAYAQPEIHKHTVTPKDGAPFTTHSVTFMSVNSVTRNWQRAFGYGGYFTENVVQAMARDLLAAAMLRVELAGYPVVLTVHDEIVSEVPIGSGTLNEFLELMQTGPEWADGLPVAVDGWEGERYRK